MTSSWRINLPWATPPVNMNDRGHWAAKAAKVSEVRHATGWAVKAAKIPAQQRIRVCLFYRPRTRRTRDADNLVATLKPAIDGIKDAGVIVDDSDRYVDRAMPVILEPTPVDAGMWLQIEAIT